MFARFFLFCLFSATCAARQSGANGELIFLHLAAAPFPHPDRSSGHVYNQTFYSAPDHYSDNSVAVFIPNGFVVSDSVDMVFHFHGWFNNLDTVLSRYRLAQQFMEAGKNAILVVPQGPRNAPDSFGGKMEDPEGFKRLVSEVLDSLVARGKVASRSPGSIIISGHSGGYHAMSFILMRGGLSDHIKEVYLFDALYGQTEKYVQWLLTNNGKIVDIYTEEGGTKEQTLQLVADATGWKYPVRSKVENDLTAEDLQAQGIIAFFTPLEHDQVMQAHSTFRDFLRASCLRNIPRR